MPSTAKPSANHPSYWPLQVSGWSMYALVGILINSIYSAWSFRMAGLAISGGLILLGLTHLLRLHAKREGWLRLSFGKLALRLFAATLLMAIFSQLLMSVLLVWVFDLLGDKTYSFAVLGIYIFQTQLILTCWVLIYFSFHAIRNYRLEEIEKWRLQASLHEAELSALKAQVNPHFLFNCLNNIRALVLENPEKARDSITRLSDLLRYNLRLQKAPHVSVQTELEVVRAYLALESIQFEDRLRTDFDIDPDTLEAAIPPLTIQTLIENAIKHGIAQQPGGGTISICTRREGLKLEILVRNTGQIQTTPHPESNRIGLQNLRERLRLLTKNEATLTLCSQDAEYVTARVTLPLLHLHESSDC